MAIYFHAEDLSFSLSDERKTAEWLEMILERHGSKAENINYIFCTDKHLHSINQRYLNHDTYTDIITFDNTEKGKEIEADIFISVERIKENAKELNKEFDDELHRVIVHGVLHLLGYSDKNPSEKREMRKKEDDCLSLR